MLQCSIAGALTAGLAGGGLLLGWPDATGVIWTTRELALLAGLGLGGGALVGAPLGAATRRAGLGGAATAGLILPAALAWVPSLPLTGRALVRADPLALGVVLGACLVVWGVVRLTRSLSVQAVVAMLLVTTMTLARGIATSRAQPPPAGPDVLLITIDTTRADLVPGFGGDRTPADMPFMSEWSRSARRFTRAYAPTALTGPSHTSILSGRHAVEHGILANGRTIPPGLAWVPLLLQSRGWHTRGWVSAAVLDTRLGFGRGFDDFDSRFERRIRHGHPLLRFIPHRRVGGTGFVREDADTVAHVVAAGPPDPSHRTFTWVHLYGPHWPYTPDPAHAERLGVAPVLDQATTGPVPLNHRTDISDTVRDHGIALYKAELRTLDDHLRRLLSDLPLDTRVVVVGDHGESLDEHGLWFNHGRLATTPTARVPLWVKGPGFAPGADDRTVSLHQLAPTLLQLADVQVDIHATHLLDTPEDAVAFTVASEHVFADDEAPHPVDLGAFAAIGVRSGPWSKTASNWHDTRWAHLGQDPRELVHTDTAPAPARSRIDAAWDRLTQQQVRAPDAVDADTQAALEALGYSEKE